jgi:hypothetical protein
MVTDPAWAEIDNHGSLVILQSSGRTFGNDAHHPPVQTARPRQGPEVAETASRSPCATAQGLVQQLGAPGQRGVQPAVLSGHGVIPDAARRLRVDGGSCRGPARPGSPAAAGSLAASAAIRTWSRRSPPGRRELQLPVFLHERAAHGRFNAILREHRPRLRAAVVHGFHSSRSGTQDRYTPGHRDNAMTHPQIRGSTDRFSAPAVGRGRPGPVSPDA